MCTNKSTATKYHHLEKKLIKKVLLNQAQEIFETDIKRSIVARR